MECRIILTGAFSLSEIDEAVKRNERKVLEIVHYNSKAVLILCKTN